MIRVERVMKLIGGAADKIIRFISNQLCHSRKHKERKKKKKNDFSVILLFSLVSFASHLKRGQRSGSVKIKDRSYLPSQCVKCKSMLWRVRKVLVSSGNSTLDG